jgi:hypothetical protein
MLIAELMAEGQTPIVTEAPVSAANAVMGNADDEA